MKSRLMLVLTALVVVAFTAPLVVGAGELPPPPGKMKKLSFPDFKEFTTENGMDVIVVEHKEQPIVSFYVVIKSGNAFDPPGKESLASVTVDQIRKGTKTRSALELAEWIESVGGSVGGSSDMDFAFISVSILSEYTDVAIAYLQDILMNPIFPTDELELVRKQLKTGLEFELSSPGAMARRHMRDLIYGDHPYSKQATLESVEAITQQDVVDFYARNYVPNNILFGVVGDVKWKDVRKKLETAFGGWQRGTPDRIDYTGAPEAGPTQIYIYHRPAAVQTEIHIGHLGLEPTNPDWPALQVGNRILGVGSDSRLYQNIRETKGWTYHVRSSYAKEKNIGFFTVLSPVRTEVTDSTLTELMSELNRIATEPVTAEELDYAKSYLIGNFPLTIETPAQIVTQVGQNKLFGIEKDALETYRERVAAVTIDDVSRVMKEYLHTDNAYIVLVGDATEIQDKVAGVANVNLFDIAGEPLSLSSLAVEPVDYQYDTGGLKSMKATYTLTSQDRNIGDLNVTIEKEKDIVRVSSSIVGMISMEETVAFRLADLSPISLKRTMQMGPNTMGADLAFTDDGCTGTVQSMGSTEPKEVTFALVDGTILDSTLEYAITCLPLDINKEYRFPVVDSQSGSMQTVRVVIMELLDVETPAGSFSTYKVKVIRPDGEAYYYFGKESPHSMVKQEVPSQGLTIVLKTLAN